MSISKIKSKCLSSWDTNAGVLLMIRLSSQVPSPYWFTVYVLIFSFFFWNLEGMHPWLVLCSLFWHQTALKTMFFGAIPQSYLRGCAPGFIPQFGSNKTLFHSSYRFFIIFLNIIKMKYLHSLSLLLTEDSLSGFWRLIFPTCSNDLLKSWAES